MLRTLRITLTAHGYRVLLAPDGATGLSMAGQHQPDLVIVDLGLPDMDGIDVVTGIRGWSSVPTVGQPATLHVFVLPQWPALGRVRGGTVTLRAGAQVLGTAPVDPATGSHHA